MPRFAVRSMLVALAHGAATIGAGAERIVTLSVPDGPRPVTVEWRALEPKGTRLVAAREVTLEGRVPVTVPDGVSLVRVLESGIASRSYFVPAGGAQATFALGPRTRGGEILGRLEPHRFRPERIQLRSRARQEDLLFDEEWRFHGAPLEAGDYDVVPLYRGRGAAEEFFRVSVADGRTTELFPRGLTAPGAARIELGERLCAEVGLRLLVRRLRGPIVSFPIIRAPDDGCLVDVEGIEPGEWRVSVTAGGERNDPRGEAVFAIEADEATDVAVRAYARVVGSVRVGGEPAVGMQLRFDRGARQWHVATDAHGAYEAVLGDPGEYAVAVGGGDLPSRTFRRTYVPGEQREDVELAMGAIAVVVRAEGATANPEPVELGLFAPDGRRRAGRVQLPGGRGSFAGLDLGAYTLTAWTASGLRSREPAQAELTAASPTASVELVLERGGGTLKVVGAGGSPLAGASASVAGRSLAERAPGVFGLDAVPAGERVIAQAPGHVAACRVLDGSSREMSVPLLLPSDLLELSLRPDAPWRDALLVGLPGSDCPVSIDDVEPQVRAEEHGVTIALRLPRGSFSLALDGQAHPVSAPGKAEIP